jgi:hypothetical protein
MHARKSFRLLTTRTLPLAILGLGVHAADASGITTRLIPAPPPKPYRVWPSTPPADCPFPPSEAFAGLGFTGRHAEYTGADTWYPSWASDGNLYSPWTDGTVNGLGSGSGGTNAVTGHATILGDDPLHLQVTNQGVFPGSPRPYEGRYPCGSLVHNGIWYYGTYCLHPSGGVPRDGITYNWPWLGPFVGFRTSTDFGRTWTDTPHTPAKPLFGEAALNGEPVRMGAPHFVDLGRNLEHSPDGKAYLVAQGASDGVNRRFAYNSWITADQVYLARVTPSLANMNNAAQYEFFAGHDAAGQPQWTRELARSQPIAEWRDHMGCVTMTYFAPLKKYLLCVTDGGNTVSKYSTYLLESDRITGPWRLAAYLKDFGEQAYFVNAPSKFIGTDGRQFWLCYAANFSSGWGGTVFRAKPRGSRYGMCLQEARLMTPGEAGAPDPLDAPDNIAPEAVVSVSSTHPDHSADGAVDGVVDGYPKGNQFEWASKGEGDSAMLRLTWAREETIDRVWLFDRPNDLDQITAGRLILSDGTIIPTGALPDDARQGLEVRFAPHKLKWLLFVVDSVKANTPNVGLAEIAVFRAAP